MHVVYRDIDTVMASLAHVKVYVGSAADPLELFVHSTAVVEDNHAWTAGRMRELLLDQLLADCQLL